MTKKFCDLCGEEISEFDGKNVRNFMVQEWWLGNWHRVDVHHSCLEELMRKSRETKKATRTKR